MRPSGVRDAVQEERLFLIERMDASSGWVLWMDPGWGGIGVVEGDQGGRSGESVRRGALIISAYVCMHSMYEQKNILSSSFNLFLFFLKHFALTYLENNVL